MFKQRTYTKQILSAEIITEAFYVRVSCQYIDVDEIKLASII